jgi:hypothetical protein
VPTSGFASEARRKRADELADRIGVEPRVLRRENRNYLYTTWKFVNARCCDTDCKDYQGYGGRGIDIHARWSERCLFGFENFAEYVQSTLGPRPKGCTLDRINNDGHYEPGNLRWATAKEQSANRRPRKVA